MRIIAAHAYRIDYEEVWVFARRRSATGPGDQALASETSLIVPTTAVFHWIEIIGETARWGKR
jgi:hypothetical protein